MSESIPTTPPQDPGATGAEVTPPAAATNPQGSGGATADDTVTLSKEDYNNLIGQRDRTNNTNSDLVETVATLEAKRVEEEKREYLSDFIESNKQTYPHITVDDLMGAETPKQVEELAKARQRRYEDVIQDNLLKVQKASDPVLSPEEKAAELERLKKNPGSGSFGRMIDLQSKS